MERVREFHSGAATVNPRGLSRVEAAVYVGVSPSQHFEASTKYLALADKAARTLATLIERLDQHRGRGQQQIIVKHVTVNADQAVVADQVVNGRTKEAGTAALLTSTTDKPIRLIEPVQRETVLVEGGGSEEK